MQVVLATSSDEEDLDELLEALGAGDGVISEIVHGDMVGSSKPAPDIFTVALKRLELVIAQAMVVGDTVLTRQRRRPEPPPLSWSHMWRDQTPAVSMSRL